jgi:hypothetical protein
MAHAAKMAREGMGQKRKRTITHLLPAASSVLDGIISLKLHLLANGHADVRGAVSHRAIASNGPGDGAVDTIHGLFAFLGASMLGSCLVGRVVIVRVDIVELGLSLLVGRRRAGAAVRLALAEA